LIHFYKRFGASVDFSECRISGSSVLKLLFELLLMFGAIETFHN